MLNAGDEGLLRSLDKLSAKAASAPTPTGSSIAAHVDHLRYGLSLMNRWSAGENPFAGADWSTSWKKTMVSEDEWRTRRAELRTEATRWLEALGTPRDVREMELNGMHRQHRPSRPTIWAPSARSTASHAVPRKNLQNKTSALPRPVAGDVTCDMRSLPSVVTHRAPATDEPGRDRHGPASHPGP